MAYSKILVCQPKTIDDDTKKKLEEAGVLVVETSNDDTKKKLEEASVLVVETSNSSKVFVQNL